MVARMVDLFQIGGCLGPNSGGLTWLHRFSFFLSSRLQSQLLLYSATFFGLCCLTLEQMSSLPIRHLPSTTVGHLGPSLWCLLGFMSSPKVLEDVGHHLFCECVYVSFLLAQGSLRASCGPLDLDIFSKGFSTEYWLKPTKQKTTIWATQTRGRRTWDECFAALSVFLGVRCVWRVGRWWWHTLNKGLYFNLESTLET